MLGDHPCRGHHNTRRSVSVEACENSPAQGYPALRYAASLEPGDVWLPCCVLNTSPGLSHNLDLLPLSPTLVTLLNSGLNCDKRGICGKWLSSCWGLLLGTSVAHVDRLQKTKLSPALLCPVLMVGVGAGSSGRTSKASPHPQGSVSFKNKKLRNEAFVAGAVFPCGCTSVLCVANSKVKRFFGRRKIQPRECARQVSRQPTT